MNRYYDYEHDQIIHEDELRKEYEAMDNQDNVTFEQYIDNCQTYNGGTLSETSGAETGWMDKETAIIYTQEQMYKQYTRILDLTDQYDNFMDFLASVTDVNGLFRRVI